MNQAKTYKFPHNNGETTKGKCRQLRKDKGRKLLKKYL